MVPACSRKIPRASRYSGFRLPSPGLRVRGARPVSPALPKRFHCPSYGILAVLTPGCTHPGLGSSGFARRYFRNHCCFLLLRLLRCFSSPGSPRTAMDSPHGGRVVPGRVSPFGHPWIAGHVPLPMAFRSLSRPSSALSAKASVLCPFLLDQLSGAVSVRHLWILSLLGSFVALSGHHVSSMMSTSDVLTRITSFVKIYVISIFGFQCTAMFLLM